MPIANTCSIGYPHDGRADNAAYRHDRRADNAAYRHDRRAASLSHLTHLEVFRAILRSSLFTIFALSAGYLLTKINIGKTGNQKPPSGGFWFPVFPILIFLKLGTSG